MGKLQGEYYKIDRKPELRSQIIPSLAWAIGWAFRKPLFQHIGIVHFICDVEIDCYYVRHVALTLRAQFFPFMLTFSTVLNCYFEEHKKFCPEYNSHISSLFAESIPA